LIFALLYLIEELARLGSALAGGSVYRWVRLRGISARQGSPT
jgi:hypothetical protein